MAARRIICSNENLNDSLRFALCTVYSDGTVGWLLGDGDRGTLVKTYASLESAKKTASQLLKNHHYSWSVPVEVRPFYGFGKSGKE